ncbi:6270_t:CDS:2 [Cetraspora pellucida]|uniref:6270_t:CDS:1 n=1 Tax=Cetraspora pellucida TaxID=1433469 RepID=A0A9N8WRV6_9GLOM|nr:6270_t:CDS:2 [Cetraspora pellucida]
MPGLDQDHVIEEELYARPQHRNHCSSNKEKLSNNNPDETVDD